MWMRGAAKKGEGSRNLSVASQSESAHVSVKFSANGCGDSEDGLPVGCGGSST
jgi:hypothetical protein